MFRGGPGGRGGGFRGGGGGRGGFQGGKTEIITYLHNSMRPKSMIRIKMQLCNEEL